MRVLIAAALALLAAAGAAQAADPPVLTIYTYNSFTSEWGPGPAVTKAFEATAPARSTVVARGRRRAAEPAAAGGQEYQGRYRARPRHQPDGGGHGDRPVRAACPGSVETLKLPIAWSDPVFVPLRLRLLRRRLRQDKLPQPPNSLKELIDGRSQPEDPARGSAHQHAGPRPAAVDKELYGDKAAEPGRS